MVCRKRTCINQFQVKPYQEFSFSPTINGPSQNGWRIAIHEGVARWSRLHVTIRIQKSRQLDAQKVVRIIKYLLLSQVCGQSKVANVVRVTVRVGTALDFDEAREQWVSRNIETHGRKVEICRHNLAVTRIQGKLIRGKQNQGRCVAQGNGSKGREDGARADCQCRTSRDMVHCVRLGGSSIVFDSECLAVTIAYSENSR